MSIYNTTDFTIQTEAFQVVLVAQPKQVLSFGLNIATPRIATGPTQLVTGVLAGSLIPRADFPP